MKTRILYLNYTYNTNSNKILKVDDVSGEESSFKDVSGNDYTYWQDGSLKSDNNKGITLIEYNYLKLPKKVVQNGVTTLYQYDATGKKLRETIGSDITDYSANKIYKNNILYQISHDEGRIVNGEYEYNIKDHLGNLRVAFKDSLGVAKIVQVNAYGVWGEDLPTLSYQNTPNLNNYKFTGKEFESQTGLYDFGWRRQDPILGRMWGQDPLAEKMPAWSSYAYAFDNPIKYIDYNGLIPIPVNKFFKGMAHRIDSWFGPRNTGIKGASKNHKGLDINFGSGQADKGAPVLATHDGVATIDNDPAGKEGRMITITSPDGKFRTKYLHLSKINISNKQNVNEASQIGEIGGSGYGSETGQQTHLHYEIEKLNEETGKFEDYNPTEGKSKNESNVVDPQTWIQKNNVSTQVLQLPTIEADATRVERNQFFEGLKSLKVGNYKVVDGKIVSQ